MTFVEEKMSKPMYHPHHWGKPNYYKLSVEDDKVKEGETAYFKVKLNEKADHNIKVY
jgi:hypothetical protein